MVIYRDQYQWKKLQTFPHECFVGFELVDEILGPWDVIEWVNDLIQSRVPLLIVQESDDLLRSQVGFVLGSPGGVEKEKKKMAGG